MNSKHLVKFHYVICVSGFFPCNLFQVLNDSWCDEEIMPIMMQEQESENEGKKRNTKNFQTMKNDEPENQNIQYLLIYYITKSLETSLESNLHFFIIINKGKLKQTEIDINHHMLTCLKEVNILLCNQTLSHTTASYLSSLTAITSR